MHCWASDTNDTTVDPRWGKVGKQKIVDEGPLAPGPDTGRTPYGGTGQGVAGAKYDMTTFDEVLIKDSIDFMERAKDSGIGATYKVHLDGYDQTDLLTGKGPSKRHEIWYFAESNLGVLRLDDFKYRPA